MIKPISDTISVIGTMLDFLVIGVLLIPLFLMHMVVLCSTVIIILVIAIKRTKSKVAFYYKYLLWRVKRWRWYRKNNFG